MTLPRHDDIRPLTVMNVAYPFAPVGRDAVGGAEQILFAIDQALVAAGHRSIVVAVQGSTASGDLITYSPPEEGGSLNELGLQKQHARAHAAIKRTLAELAVDVIHMHGVDFYRYLPLPGPPVLATMHLPLTWYPPCALALQRPLTWLNCVSATQAAGAEPNPNMLPHIANGVAVEEFDLDRPTRRRYVLMLARVCPEKGQHLALQAAHAANISLLIGGEIFPYREHQEYFDWQVTPLLDQRRRYIGPVGFVRKRRLLAGATCLVIPSAAPETSSLVAMEAASSGTPVVAFRVGALPEVIENGLTGFLVDDVNAMAEAIRKAGEIDPEVCRVVARQRFGVQRMTGAYISQYHELAKTILGNAD